jgi:hypothetical protein
MFMLPGLPECGLKLSKTDRLRYFAQNFMPKYDVICMQEIFYTLTDRKESLKYYAEISGFPFHARSSQPPMFGGCTADGGLVTISRYPILESEWCPFKLGAFSDSCANKGFLYTKIKF